MPLLTLLSTIFMIIAAILVVNFIGFNVTRDMDPPPVRLYIEPAGYAFIIWSFIYIGYIVLGIHQYRPKYRDDKRFIEARPYIILNALANALWFSGVILNVLWLTVVFMIIMLYTLIKLSIIFELGKPTENWEEKVAVKLPLALYFGWITIATPINFTSFLLVDFGLTGQSSFGPEVWSIIILIVAVAIVMTLYLTKKVNGTYLLVGVWALTAVYVANSGDSQLVATASLILSLGLVSILVFYSLIRKIKHPILM